jgi:hypothetical protein
MIKIGQYINQMIDSNNHKKINKLITYDHMNLVELTRFDLYKRTSQ